MSRWISNLRRLLAALAIDLFIAPYRIAPGGIRGLAIINSYLLVPLGAAMLVPNTPALYIGYRKLGGGPFLVRSLYATLVFDLSVDSISAYLPRDGLTEGMILNAIFGGVLLGAGAGDIVNRALQATYGLPINVTSL